MDQFDRATELEEAHREAALARQREQMPQGESATECFDCGATIPDRRRWAVPGAARCVECQEIIEQNKKRGL